MNKNGTVSLIELSSNNKALNPYKNVMGIYGIYLNNDLVYIGQSKNIGERWKIHKHHIVKVPSKCREHFNDFIPLYTKLRNCYYAGCGNIYFNVIEIISDKSILKEKESEYIDKLKPQLNVKP